MKEKADRLAFLLRLVLEFAAAETSNKEIMAPGLLVLAAKLEGVTTEDCIWAKTPGSL